MAQSTANPDFAFEVGKSYYIYSKKSTVTITKRSACYVSGVDENGETFRRKILKYAATYSYNGDGRVYECIALHEHVHVSARDEFTAETTTHAHDDAPEALYLDAEPSYSDTQGGMGDNSDGFADDTPAFELSHGNHSDNVKKDTHDEIMDLLMTDDVITLALHIAYSDSYSEICDIIGKIHSQQLRALAYISGIHTISQYNNNKRAIARKLIDRVALPIDDIIENRAPSAISEQDNFIVRLFKEAHARVSFAPEIPPEPEINPNPQHGDILYSSAFRYCVKKKAIPLNYSVKLIKRDCNTNSEKWAGAITLLFIDENGQNLAAFAPYSSLVQVNTNHELLRKNPVRQVSFIHQATKDITEKRTKILQSINFLDDHGNRISDGLEAFRYCYYRDNMYCKGSNAYFRELFRKNP